MAISRGATVAPWLTNATSSHGSDASAPAAAVAARATCSGCFGPPLCPGQPGPGRASSKAARISAWVWAGKVLASRDNLSAFRSRRVIIKTRIVKMRGTGAKAAALHLRYIQRDGVTQDGRPGELYGRDTDRADGKDFLERSGEDRHQFRFIVSAEDAGEYPDLKPFVRKLMARMESNLGTSLDWVAVDHHKPVIPIPISCCGAGTIRGRIVIARTTSPMACASAPPKSLTLDLGPRTDLEIEDRFARQVTQERFTDLEELSVAGETYARSLGKPYATATSGQVEGIYRGPVQLLSGRFAVVERTRDFTLVPWRPAPGPRIGQTCAKHHARRQCFVDAWPFARSWDQLANARMRV